MKKFINSDPVAVFTFEIVLNREMQAKYYAAISLPIGLDAKLSCQRIIFLIDLKCVVTPYKFVQYVTVILEQRVNTYCHWLPVISRQQAKTESK